MKFDPDYPEILVDLAMRTKQRLVALGMPDDRAELAARELAEHLREHWGGQMLYIPQGAAYEISLRDQEIWTKFNGDNHNALAREFQLSVQTVYKVIDRMRDLHRRRMQLPLFQTTEGKERS